MNYGLTTWADKPYGWTPNKSTNPVDGILNSRVNIFILDKPISVSLKDEAIVIELKDIVQDDRIKRY